MREHGDEFLNLDSDIGVTPNYGSDDESGCLPSGNGAGALGFAGTVHKDAALQAVGLTMLAGDEYGGGPRMPMVPGTWEQGLEDGKGLEKDGKGWKRSWNGPVRGAATVSTVRVSTRNRQRNSKGDKAL